MWLIILKNLAFQDAHKGRVCSGWGGPYSFFSKYENPRERRYILGMALRPDIECGGYGLELKLEHGVGALDIRDGEEVELWDNDTRDWGVILAVGLQSMILQIGLLQCSCRMDTTLQMSSVFNPTFTLWHFIHSTRTHSSNEYLLMPATGISLLHRKSAFLCPYSSDLSESPSHVISCLSQIPWCILGFSLCFTCHSPKHILLILPFFIFLVSLLSSLPARLLSCPLLAFWGGHLLSFLLFLYVEPPALTLQRLLEEGWSPLAWPKGLSMSDPSLLIPCHPLSCLPASEIQVPFLVLYVFSCFGIFAVSSAVLPFSCPNDLENACVSFL